MKITAVQVDGFGVWSGLSIGSLGERLTVFFGPNEAGKTTLMQFVRAVLYGFTEPRRRRYLPPLHGGRAGGSLQVSDRLGCFEIRRTAGEGETSDAAGQVAVVRTDGAVQSPDVLNSLLGGIDEPIFDNVFAFGLRELQELGALSDTEAADHLYKLTGGLDRVSLVDVMRGLKSSRLQLLDQAGNDSQIGSLLSRRQKLQGEIEQLVEKARCWPRLSAQRSAIDQQTARSEQAVRQLELEARTVETALQVRDKWLTLKQLETELAALGPPLELPSRALQQTLRIAEASSRIRERLRQVTRQRVGLRRQAASQPINRALWSQRAQIEALGDHANWLVSLESQVERLRAETAELEAELAAQNAGLGLPAGDTSSHPLEVSRSVLAALSNPARAVRDETRRLKQARQESAARRQENLRITQQLESSLAQHGVGDFAAALARAGERVSRLRRRLHVGERLDHMTRNRRDLEEQSRCLFEGQPPPIWILAGLGVLFVLGAVLILTGLLGGALFGFSGTLGWLLSLLGLGGSGAAAATKIVLERSAARQLESCNRQLELLELQTRQAEQEREELDRELPPSKEPLENRLKTAKKELEQLEELAPLDANRQSAVQQNEAAQRRADQAADSLRDARRLWRVALRRAGLPQTLAPRQVRAVAGRSQQSSDLLRRLAIRRDELQQRQRDLADLASRIEQLLRESKLQPAAGDLQGRLRQLTAALSQQRQLAKHRAVLLLRDRRLRARRARWLRQQKNLLRRRQAILTAAGASDESQLQQLAQQQARQLALQQQRQQLTAEVAAAIGGQCSEQQVAEQLAALADGPEGGKRLEQQWDQTVSRLHDAQAQLAQLHQRRGAIDQEMNSLAKDRRLDEAKLEMGCVEQQLRTAVARWQVAAVTEGLLESIRQIYERDRQPQALREASRYLNVLTSGQYMRLWTPLGDNALKADDANGASLPLELLSGGTREAVFLSLRLALAAAFARRGATLPLVLDDVLVNLDAQRTKAAAAALRDFAKSGHQVLLFTCHEHIVKAFKSFKTEIRVLPNRGETRSYCDPHRQLEIEQDQDEPRPDEDEEPFEEHSPPETTEQEQDAEQEALEPENAEPEGADAHQRPWQRFTWESPERWWRHPPRDAAA